MEEELVDWLQRRLPPLSPAGLGIGDDAAICPWRAGSPCVVTTDLLVDGVHFDWADTDPRRVGHKTLAVNLSDLAAMAAEPVAAVVSVAIPQATPLVRLQELYEGMLELAEAFDTAIVGGDTNSTSGPLTLSITAFGQLGPKGPLLRSGGAPGDRLVVTGSLGGSISGHHLDFTPRVAEALDLHARYTLSAGLDISDGLSLDLSRLARASGCGAELDLAAIPVSAAAKRMAETGEDGPSAIDCALSDGEDFELLLALPPEEAKKLLADPAIPYPISLIGQLVEEEGLWQRNEQGERQPLPPKGFLHK